MQAIANNEQCIIIEHNDNEISVESHFTTYFKLEEGGLFACHIPSFDIHFSAKDEDSVEKKSKALSRMFVDHFMLHVGKNGIKSFTLQLHKLGFKAKDDTYTVKQLINNQPINAKFKSLKGKETLPSHFMDARSMNVESKMAVLA